MATAIPDEDSLAGLEERIRRIVEMVNSMRVERDAAFADRDAARQAAGTALSELQRLREENEEFRNERKHVRTRVEKLLGQMDLLAGS